MSIFSYFRKKSDPNYEEILSSLEKKIVELETQITKIKIQHHTISASLLVYGIGGYMIYLITYWLVLNLPNDPTEVKLLKAFPIFAVPILIYLLRWVNSTFNEKRIFYRKTKLQTLKKEQKLKVEELKEKTSYNSIQKMLEKFDPELKQNQLRQRISPNARAPNGQGMSPSASLASPGQHRGLTKSTSTPSLKDKARQQGSLRSPSDIPVTQEFHPSAQDYSSAGERAWYDKIVDVLIGEDDYQKQFALICPNCNQHNGLVSAQDYEMIQYTCPKCEKFIPSRASIRNSSRLTHSQLHPRPPFPQSHIETINRPVRPRNNNGDLPSPAAPQSPILRNNETKPISEPKSPVRSERSSPNLVEPMVKEEEEKEELEEEREKPQLLAEPVGDEDETTKQLLDKLLSQ